MYKHGGKGTRLYRIWTAMKTRCYNHNSQAYHNYGLRGIKVCDEWLNDFGEFKKWAYDNGYNECLTIDRVDNDGDYTPDNCKWSTVLEQCNNTRKNIKLCYNGDYRTISEWARVLDINVATLSHRYRKGYSTPQILGYQPLVFNRKARAVEQLNLNGDVINEFTTIKNAVQRTGILKVGECCRGRRKTAGGYKWRFKNG